VAKRSGEGHDDGSDDLLDLGLCSEPRNVIKSGHQSITAFKEYTLSDYLQHEHHKIYNFLKLQRPGRALVNMCCGVSNGEDSRKKLVEVNGRATHIKTYANETIDGSNPVVTGLSS
jgi:hypothetical protein